ncbi:MAG: carboxymuconolactone decarboxylase [Pseudonocardiales bacterium]|nr:MAG: carboxymuconolactone decarboxylase [Pseudonocardiales bacterium]
MTTDRFARGQSRQRSLGTNTARAGAYDDLADIAPDLPRLATEFAYGDIHCRSGLSAGKRELVIIAVLITLGDVEPQIEAHVSSALGAGVEPREIVEAVIQTIPYAGFPRALRAMSSVRGTLQAHGALDQLAIETPTPTRTQTED